MGRFKLPNTRAIPIRSARLIAHVFGYEQVIIYGRRHSDKSREHMTTYGVDKPNCAVAADMGKILQRFMGWCGEPTRPNPAVAAIKFALDLEDDMDGNTFLRMWMREEYEALGWTWENIPNEVFMPMLDSKPQKTNRVSLRSECLNMVATSRHTGEPIDTEQLAAALHKTAG